MDECREVFDDAGKPRARDCEVCDYVLNQLAGLGVQSASLALAVDGQGCLAITAAEYRYRNAPTRPQAEQSKKLSHVGDLLLVVARAGIVFAFGKSTRPIRHLSAVIQIDVDVGVIDLDDLCHCRPLIDLHDSGNGLRLRG